MATERLLGRRASQRTLGRILYPYIRAGGICSIRLETGGRVQVRREIGLSSAERRLCEHRVVSLAPIIQWPRERFPVRNRDAVDIVGIDQQRRPAFTSRPSKARPDKDPGSLGFCGAV